MPFAPAQASRSVAVVAVTVSLEVTPGPPWYAHQQVTLKARVMYDGSPAAGTLVRFYVIDYETGFGEPAGPDVQTDGNGYATMTYTIPYAIGEAAIPCGQVIFRAYHLASGTVSGDVVGKVAYQTSITIEAPDKVARGTPFTVSGALRCRSAPDTWSPLPYKTVSIYYNGNKLADARTGSDGGYSVQVSIPTTGTFTLKAVYAGEGLGGLGGLGPVADRAARSVVKLAPAILGSLLLALA